MSDTSGISPWSHPKAQEWFELIFERSGALLNLQDEVHKHGSEFNISQLRMFASIFLLLGRDGLWPSNQQGDLIKVVEKLSETLRRLTVDSRPPLTVDEHKIFMVMASQAEHEIELLRRTVGLSKRISKLGQPPSWAGFWCR